MREKLTLPGRPFSRTSRQITAYCGLFLLCLMTNMLMGQDRVEITGYVVDKESGEPVPFASVGVAEQQRGISANLNGFFRLLLRVDSPDHHLQISSIGYKQLSISLSDIDRSREQRFELIPQPTILDEIVILGKSQGIEGLVKHTSKNRKVYLRSTPYLMNGFYREVLKVDEQHGGITEAQGILYLNGYNASYKNNSQHLTYDLVQWKHIRRSNYPESTGKYLEIAPLLKAKDYYLHHGPLHRKNLSKLNYQISDSTLYQDRLVLVIEFEPKPEFSNVMAYSGRMLVKEDDQALISLEVEASGSEPFLSDGRALDKMSHHFEINFMLFEGQYYLNRCRFKRSYFEENQKFEWNTELVGASFSNQRAMFLNPNQRVVLFSEMLNPIMNYDPDFWDDFGFSQGADYLQMLKQDSQLHKQFRSHHNLRLTPLPEGIENYQQMANDRNALDFIMQR